MSVPPGSIASTDGKIVRWGASPSTGKIFKVLSVSGAVVQGEWADDATGSAVGAVGAVQVSDGSGNFSDSGATLISDALTLAGDTLSLFESDGTTPGTLEVGEVNASEVYGDGDIYIRRSYNNGGVYLRLGGGRAGIWNGGNVLSVEGSGTGITGDLIFSSNGYAVDGSRLSNEADGTVAIFESDGTTPGTLECGDATFSGAVESTFEVGGSGESYRISHTDTTYGRSVGFYFNNNGATGGIKSSNNLNVKTVDEIYLSPNNLTFGARFTKDASSNSVIFAAQQGSLICEPAATTYIPDVVRGKAGQTADLTQWQDSDSNVLASVSADGDIVSFTRTLTELSADPSDPAEGKSTIWQSDGTGSGDDGDILIKVTAGGTTKTATLVDFSTV